MRAIFFCFFFNLVGCLKIATPDQKPDHVTEDSDASLAFYERRRVKEGVLPDADLPADEYYKQLRETIKKNCGITCEYTPPSGKGAFFDAVSKPNQCDALFSENMMQLDGLSNIRPPPKEIPKVFRADFTMGDEQMPIRNWYIDDTFLAEGNSKQRREEYAARWKKENIDTYVANVRAGNFNINSGYSAIETKAIYDGLVSQKSDLQGKHCAVLGSQRPWLEALLLSVGVSNITTIEYSDITSSHPALTALHPSDWGKLRAQGQMFDCVASYSSLEHSGLGRYGDILNPWGDLIAMGKLVCSTKPGGIMLVGYPMENDDRIAWNAHRYYGPKRWAQMLANTKQLYKQEGTNGNVVSKDMTCKGICQGFVIAQKL